MKIMTFHLSDGAYAVDLSAVVEVVRGRGRAGDGGAGDGGRGAVAGGGTAVRGGRTVPVFDLAGRLGAERVAADDGPVLILRGKGREAGVRVNRLGEVLEVDAGRLRGLPRYFASPLLRGMAEVEDGLVVLLDSEALLAAADADAAAAVADRQRDEVAAGPKDDQP